MAETGWLERAKSPHPQITITIPVTAIAARLPFMTAAGSAPGQ